MLTKLFILAFVFGTALLQRQPVLPGSGWIVIGLFLVMGIIGLQRSTASISVTVRNVSSWFLFLLAGFLWAAFVADLRLSDRLPSECERCDVQLVGVIANLPQKTDHGIRFHLDVERVITNGAVAPKRIALSWYYERQAKSVPVVNPGERWQLAVRLKHPRGHANPHGFDYEVWSLERSIGAVGYVRASPDNQRIADWVNHPTYWIEYFRAQIQRHFDEALPNHTYAGVLKALATGDQQAIPRDQWQVFTRTGTNHLMAISGLHITMVASFVFAIAYWLWRRSAYLSLRIPARRIAAAAGLGAALGYAMLSGFAIPAQRALYMLAAVAIALWFARRISASTLLAWALFVVVVLDPWATISPGFWLSFGAIAVIMLVTGGRIGRLNWPWDWMRIQWAITLGLIPLLLALFQQVSLVSPIANAIAIPIVSLIVVPLTLLATIPVFDVVLPIAYQVISMMMTILQEISTLPHVVWQQHAPPTWTIVVAVIGIFWALLPGGLGIGFFSGFPARWLGLVAMLPMFWVAPLKPGTGELWLTVLDVGQGLAVVVRTQRHTLLFDTGPGFGETDSGSRIIIPFLRGEGIHHIDRMIVSHADFDHSGGALSVLQAVPVRQILSSLDDRHAILQAVDAKEKCHSGQAWRWDDVDFEILYPASADYRYVKRQSNANNCVLKITTEHGSVLLPADIEAKDESVLLARIPDKLSSTILIAPHHGSQTSSTEAFLRKTNPALTIFAVGYLNRYQHPNAAVLSRYRDLDKKWLRSDEEGAIRISFAEGGWMVSRWRESYRRYWQQ